MTFRAKIRTNSLGERPFGPEQPLDTWRRASGKSFSIQAARLMGFVSRT
jgi:hypothetical protein